MESFPRFKERGEPEIEVAFESLKEPMVKICRQLKEKIDSDAYDILVSDEAGGRIPTLILREIINQVRPKEHIDTLFVASGRHPEYSGEHYLGYQFSEAQNYLRKGLKGNDKVLLVTQIVASGAAVRALTRLLRRAGAETIDAVSITGPAKERDGYVNTKQPIFSIDNYYSGGQPIGRGTSPLEHNHEILSGVTKSSEPNPKPMRLDKAIDTHKNRSKYISTREWELIKAPIEKDLGRRPDSFLAGPDVHQTRGLQDSWNQKLARRLKQPIDEINQQPLSGEEKVAIQENINMTRAHIKELAKEVVKDVWPELALDAKQ